MKIEKLSENEIKTFLYIVVAVLVVVFLVKAGKGILEKLGLKDTKDEEEQKKKQQQYQKQLVKDLTSKTKPTRTAAQWASVANVLDNALNSLVSDESTAFEQLARILTDADMGLVIEAYGTRDKGMTLPERVRDEMNMGYIDELNRLYAKSKMRFKF